MNKFYKYTSALLAIVPWPDAAIAPDTTTSELIAANAIFKNCFFM